MNIPTVDLQHGLQGPYHQAYAKWQSLPREGYQLLPKYFAVWSEYEKNTILSWSNKINNHYPLIIGNPFIREWKTNKYFDVVRKKKIKKIYSNHHTQYGILVTLQDKLPPEWLIKVIQSSPSSWFWWLRLHPLHIHIKKSLQAMLKKNMVKNNVDINIASKAALFSLLENSKLHITQYSSAVIEAYHFGVTSIIIDKIGKINFQEYIDKDKAVFISNADQLKHYVYSHLTTKKNNSYANENYSETEIDYLIKLASER